MFRSSRQHLERRTRHGRFSNPLAPAAASQAAEAASAPECPVEPAPGVPQGAIPSTANSPPGTLLGGLFSAGYWRSSGRTLAAWGPFGPDVTSNSTAWPSSSER
jgi:hypothetical protein